MKTLYVKRPVSNWRQIAGWAKEQGFETTLDSDMHVTIMFSKSPVDWDEFEERKGRHVATNGKREVKPLGDQGAIVLKFEDDSLEKRWKQFKDGGCSWDYSEYQSHITITYGGHDDLSKVTPYRGPIILGGEEFKEVDLDWDKKIKEE